MVAGTLGGVVCASTGGNPVAAGWAAGTMYGLLDGITHINTAKGLEGNLYDIGFKANTGGFSGALYGTGWKAAGSALGGMYLSEPLNVFLHGASGNALAGSAKRYIYGKGVNAETVL